MKSFNLNVLQAVSTLFAAGEITIADLNAAIAEKRGLNQPCGHAADFHGHFYSLFVATDKEDRGKVTRSKDGARVKFNLRANDVKKKEQVAQTPGQLLPQGVQGAPAITPQVAALLAALGIQVPQEQPTEEDFSDLNQTLAL